MANRILLGKSTNSNLGHSSGEFGLYISRPGDDVTNCTKDQLIFNTDNVGSVSGAIDLGQFQVVPTSGTNATASVSVNASSTATVSHANLGTGNLLLTNNSFASSDLTGQSPTSNVTTSRFGNAGFTGTTSGTLSNGGNASATFTVAVIRGFLTTSLF